jgi:membrane associated rhomboid family serine protease
MLLPIRTSIVPSRTPYINYAIIIANVIIFILEYHVSSTTGHLVFRPWVGRFMLVGSRPQIWQFISYAFLHQGFLHIAGNMYFLYLFGNNVNDKLGSVGYLSFYLAGAVFSGIGHILVGGGNVLGASGAVAAVTGAYLVLFPQTLITVVYWFFFIGAMDLPALYLIAFKMIIFDNLINRSAHNIAYGAHLAGYAFGITSMIGMLATGLIEGSSYDLWSMIKRWNRRRCYRDVVSSGYDPFTGQTDKKQIKVKEVIKSAAQQQKEDEITDLRTQISARMAERNVSAAAAKYLELMELDDEQIIPRQHLLDIANQLAGENNHSAAAHAYEQFLKYYPTYEYSEQVELMLGIIYARYLNRPESAVNHLQAAAKKLSDPGQLQMCRDELDRLQG